ncbi:hypothetical protein C5167_033054 [Papaver somniferum]|uniref:Homeobox-leucine zipper protein n=1 Tax=Papaver somniferum TaxID=3469 RepID=A0A4Y7KD39_PAPSO|nr:homeobox-leucine zipper protein ATHB-13-like [Papaver somniferum]RZC69879.1 hypothetical protein C5167_033054 [Papaver somniferum]
MGSCNGMAFFPSSFMVQNSSHHDQEDHHHHPTSFNSVLPSSFTSLRPVDFHGTGVASLPGKKTSSMAFTGFDVCDHHQENNNNGEEDYSDDGSQMGEKKRRLNMEQVKTLEKNFELGNKLEPERKMQLARALGLQPRQIAIWFQNRRARWKTKSLEKDYDILKRQFDAVKADNEALQSQNKKLRDEVLALKSKEIPTHEYIINLNKETDQQGCSSSSNRSDNSSEINLDLSRRSTTTSSAIDSPTTLSSSHRQQIVSSTNTRPTTITTLFPSSSSSTSRPNQIQVAQQILHHQNSQQYHQKSTSVDNALVQPHQEESLINNIFCGIDDQPNFWPWQEQQQFHN